MIRRTFREPNFRCDATDEDGRRTAWLTAGESADALQRRLSARGWTIHNVTPYDFDTWRAKSRTLGRAVQAALDRGENAEFDRNHWGELKLHLFELFESKCAYCEARVRHVASGDVEHFRPKRGVEGDPEHPGYYWLAYDVTNLLPACERCNRAGAKMNRFPVEDGTRARAANELGGERPLLLHPYGEDEPLEHLDFLPTGQVEGGTAKGRWSVEIYRLKRGDLRDARLEHYGFLEQELATRTVTRGLGRAGRELIEELAEGKREYSAALLTHLSRLIADELRELAMATEHLPPRLRRPGPSPADEEGSR